MSGPRDPTAAFIALRHTDERAETGRYPIEGTRFLIAALAARTAIDTVLTARCMCADVATDAVEAARRRGARVVDVSAREFRRLSTAAEPTGVAAIVRQRWGRLTRPARDAQPLWLALGRIRSAGNLGTILRTAAAAGATGVILLDPRTDPFDPVAVRASMGAVLSVALVRSSAEHLAAWKRRVRAVIVGTSAKASRDYRSLPRGRSLVLLMGCERFGLTRAERRLCDLTVSIPMAPSVSSLNVAVATGVVLFAARSR